MAQEMLMEKLSGELSGAIKKASQSIVLVQGRRFPSSGIAWRKDIVVAADHSLPRSQQVQIRTAAGEAVTATVAGRDPALDLALLKTNGDLVPVERSEKQLQPGQLALLLARAHRGRDLAMLTMVSGSGEAYRNWRGGTFDQFIRLDIAPFPGFSGSALLLPSGKVAGLNTSAFSTHFGLTVPSSNIERLVERLSTKGSVGRPYLGLMMQPVRIPENLRQAAGGGEIGLLLMGTEPGSPAEAAGLMIGDVLVQIEGKNLNSTEEIHEILTSDSIGKEVNAGVLRGGTRIDVKMKVGERPTRQHSE
jgi:S1-C subfamily serine protease